MSDTPQIWEQFNAIHESIRAQVEAHFNKDLEYKKFHVCALSCYSRSEFMRRAGDTHYIPYATDAKFDVKLADITDWDPFNQAITCTVHIQSTGEIYIENIRRSERVNL